MKNPGKDQSVEKKASLTEEQRPNSSPLRDNPYSKGPNNQNIDEQEEAYWTTGTVSISNLNNEEYNERTPGRISPTIRSGPS